VWSQARPWLFPIVAVVALIAIGIGLASTNNVTEAEEREFMVSQSYGPLSAPNDEEAAGQTVVPERPGLPPGSAGDLEYIGFAGNDALQFE